MTLIAINTYAERLDGDVVVWLVISRQDGKYMAMTFQPSEVGLLIDALAEAKGHAEHLMLPGDATGS